MTGEHDSNLDAYARQIAAQCVDFRSNDMSQTSGGWLYQQIQHGAQRYGVSAKDVYEKIVALDSLSGISFTPLAIMEASTTRKLKGFVTTAQQKLYDITGLRQKLGRLKVPTGAYVTKAKPQFKASIIVLSYNRKEYLQTTIESIIATVDVTHHELIVVDNGSTDGSAEYLAKLSDAGKITKLILRRKNHGTSPGYNCGIAYADPHSDYLVKLDSDIITMTPGWLERFDELFRRHEDIAILSMYIMNNPLIVHIRSEFRQQCELVNWVHWIQGGCGMTIPRKIFNQLGYFNESFEYKYMPDDVDYYWRSCMLGLETYHVKDILCFHREDLDVMKYKTYTLGKMKLYWEKSNKLQQTLAKQYLCGEKQQALFYEHYANCHFAEGQRSIVID